MSDALNLPAEARERAGKGASRALRRDGRTPAVIYGGKEEPTLIHVEQKELVKQLMTGHFMNSIVNIEIGGKIIRTLPKDVAFHPVTDRPIHVDFLRMTGDSKVEVQVPVVFVNETASDSAAPGGGSISALAGALGAALGTMVANLSAIKKGWEDRLAEFSPWAEQGQTLKDKLLALVDEDTRAFDAIMNAFALPKDTPEQVSERKQAIQNASKYATEVPFRTMQTAFECIPLLKQMAEHGNPNSLSDVGVGALCIKTAVRGAWLNVLINAQGLSDKTWAENIVTEARALLAKNHAACDEIILGIEAKLGG